MNYKIINKTRKIIIFSFRFPFRLIFYPFRILVAFLITDFEDEREREYFIGEVKQLFRF